MHSSPLHWLVAQAREEEARRAANGRWFERPSRRRRRRLARGAATAPAGAAFTIRHAFPDDGMALMRLAALDSAEPLAQPVLLAEVEGELRAALSLVDGAVISDPFQRTVALVELLAARAGQLAAAGHAAARAEIRSRRQVWRVLRAGS